MGKWAPPARAMKNQGASHERVGVRLAGGQRVVAAGFPGSRRPAVLCLDPAFLPAGAAETHQRSRRRHRRPRRAAILALERSSSGGRGRWLDHPWVGGPGGNCPTPISTGCMPGRRYFPSSMPGSAWIFSRSTTPRFISLFIPMATLTNLRPGPRRRAAARPSGPFSISKRTGSRFTTGWRSSMSGPFRFSWRPTIWA